MYDKIIFAIVFTSILLGSCKKQNPVCKGNCLPVTIEGRVVNASKAQGLPNIPITVEWHRAAYCIGCTVYEIGAMKTKNDGSFSISAIIDTLMFRDYFMTIQMPADTNYFIASAQSGPHFFTKYIDSSDAFVLRPIEFQLYEKVPLTVRLHRLQPVNFSNYSFGISYNNLNVNGYFSYYPPGPVDTTFYLTTVPDVFTKVYQRKNFADFTFTEKTDSIICTAGGSNTIDINY